MRTFLITISFVLMISLLLVTNFQCSSPTGNEIYCGGENVVSTNTGIKFQSNGGLFIHGETQSDDFSRTGVYSFKLNKDHPFGPTFKIKNGIRGTFYEVSVWRKGNHDKGFLVVSIGGGSVLYIKTQTIEKTDESGWQLIRMRFTVPVNYINEEIVFYLWNEDDEDVYFDDFTITTIGIRKPPSKNHLEIFLDDLAFEKLKAIRIDALQKKLLERGNDDWVIGYGVNNSDTLQLKIRLKGDWVDHLTGDKWSFRLKILNNKSIMGIREFSIQNPSSRNFLMEWVVHKLCDQIDVLTTRYDFVPVSINGVYLGLYAMEEHFTKQLLESRNRREAPILKFDESGFFERFLYNPNPDPIDYYPCFPSAVILPFKKGKTAKNKALYPQFISGQNLLYEYRNELKMASDIFEINSLAKYAALIDVCKGYHAIRWHNQRFYYNPITAKLEPVLYDAYIDGGIYNEKRSIFTLDMNEASADSIYTKLFNDRELVHAYVKYLEEFSHPGFFDSISNSFRESIIAFESQIKEDYPFYTYNHRFIIDNSKSIRENLKDLRSRMQNNDISLVRKKNPSIVLNRFCNDTILLSAISIKAYKQELENNIMKIKIQNYHCSALKIIGFGSDGVLKKFLPEPLDLNKSDNIEPIASEVLVYGLYKEVFFQQTESDSIYKSSIIQWPYPMENQQANAGKYDLLINSELFKVTGNVIVFNKGVLNVKERIIIPEKYQVIIKEGTRLIFAESCGIVTYSPINIGGTKEQPVYFEGSGNESGYLFGLQISEPSKLSNVIFSNISAFNDFGSHITGAVTFYESKVKIDACVFKDNLSEDAVNLIRSEFNMNDCAFENIASDAIDIDFSNGTINNVTISNCGNDGLDISGSNVVIDNFNVNRSGDKGLSVGEESIVTAGSIRISNSILGVSSKDNSKLQINFLTLEDCNTGLAAFKKKPEYGHACIEVSSIKTMDVKVLALVDSESEIHIEGQKIIETEPFDLSKIYPK